ncbi:hypothetical protein M0208_05250 [Sphingomonas sp. SUN019]|uniref:hypothetical protein n=1 Tax=Sphingomonas sp. SUN019 TaxID=2937788 RepID=UPI002164CFB6|nr:hypothetical protein [Sphingomonas sp. SUN019]UVO49955.1 hypothetical protein M0208_05250 [Sphingomonas sp. SUN019]
MNHVKRRTVLAGAIGTVASFGAIAATAKSKKAGIVQKTGSIGSVSRIAFGPNNTLFVADWVNSKVHALSVASAAPATGASFNIDDLDTPLRNAFGDESFVLEDMTARAGSSEVYVALSLGPKKMPGIVAVTADGKVRPLDLAALKSTSAALDASPSKELTFWGKIPGRSFTVTDMVWRNGKLYLAGLSNQDFASTLRILPYPFDAKAEMISVEMYHTVHNQMETRAPIRAMTFADLGGSPYLVAAYLCTPLVTIPLEALKDGAHVKGKTIAEMGYAGIPVNLINYSAFNFQTQKPESYLMVANLFRESSIVPMSSVGEANAGPGHSAPTPFGEIAGVKHIGAATAGVIRIADQDQKFLVALRRDLATGKAQLVSINKTLVFRLSDFDVSEYLFPDYAYSDPNQVKNTLPMQNMLKVDEGYPDLIRKPG